MSRIELSDSIIEVATKMCDGNPGGLSCVCELIKHEAEIDPDQIMAPMGSVFTLDRLGIYGTSIYILWKDQCKQDLRSLVMVLRANQLGILPSETLKRVAADQMRTEQLDLESLDKQVCEQLPRFQKPPQVKSVDS